MGFTRTIICGEVAEDPKTFGGSDGKKEKLELRVYDGRLHHTIIVWEPTATPAKGDTIIAEGRIGYRSYENKAGATVWATEFVSQASGLIIIGDEDSDDDGLNFA